MRVQGAQIAMRCGNAKPLGALCGVHEEEDHMANLIRTAAIAAIGAAAWAGAASFTPAAAAPLEGLTQDLSAACRTVVTTRWNAGRKVTVRKKVCGTGYGYVAPAYRVTT